MGFSKKRVNERSMSKGEDFVLLLSTVSPGNSAKKIAKSLVSESLVACVNQIPLVFSCYRWKGKVCEEKEALLMIKTRRSLLNATCARLRELHPYEVPEILELPLRSGFAAYLRWIEESTRPVKGKIKRSR